MKQAAVYIFASQRNGTLYIGVMSDLVKRAWQHKNHVVDGFTEKYAEHMLVFHELHSDMLTAIAREKQLKKWNRAWKIRSIETDNPQWLDLWNDGKQGAPSRDLHAHGTSAISVLSTE